MEQHPQEEVAPQLGKVAERALNDAFESAKSARHSARFLKQFLEQTALPAEAKRAIRAMVEATNDTHSALVELHASIGWATQRAAAYETLERKHRGYVAATQQQLEAQRRKYQAHAEQQNQSLLRIKALLYELVDTLEDVDREELQGDPLLAEAYHIWAGIAAAYRLKETMRAVPVAEEVG